MLVQNKEDSITLKICKELSLTPFHYKILIIGDSERNQNIINLFNAGASGFVSKNASVEELFKAITSVLKGKHNFSQKIAKIMSTATHKQKTYKTELSAKEIEIVACMIEGMHNKQIAEKLNISYRTVEVHKSHIFNKLHTSNIADIIKYALQNGLYKL